MPSRRAEPTEHDQGQFPARFSILYTVVPSVVLDSVAARFSFFDPSMGLPATMRAVRVRATLAKSQRCAILA